MERKLSYSEKKKRETHNSLNLNLKKICLQRIESFNTIIQFLRED